MSVLIAAAAPPYLVRLGPHDPQVRVRAETARPW